MAAPSGLPKLNVYQAAAQYRADLMAREQSVVDDFVARWLRARAVIESELDAVTRRTQAALDSGRRPVALPYGSQIAPDEFSASWLYKIGRFDTLARAIDDEVRHYSATNLDKIAARVSGEAINGERDAASLLDFRVRDDGMVAPKQFAQLPDGALQQITGQLGPNGPTPKAFLDMTPDLVQRVQDRLVQGIAAGINPRVVGRQMLRDAKAGNLLDMPLYQQLRVARTEPLRAYRESSRATYQANSDVVEQWEWHCFAGANTCPFCLAMDGSLHPLDDTMDTHPMCRCAMLPVTELSGRPAMAGSLYLYQLDAAGQDDVFGSHTMGELYRRGHVALSDIPEFYQTQDWGTSGRAASMKSLVARGVITDQEVVHARSSRTARPTWEYRRPAQSDIVDMVPHTSGVVRNQK